MGIEFKPNFDAKKLAEDLKKKQKAILEVQMADAATEIVLRSRAGQDARGGAFKRLSPKYEIFKKKKGRQGKADLTFSGLMLASIGTRVQEIGGKLVGIIFFRNAQAAARAQGNMRTRKFFELAASQIKKITNKLQGN